MTDKQQPDALRLAELLTADEWPGHMTLVSYARECVAELRRLHAENETLRAGYAAAPTTQPAPVAPGESLCNDPRLCCRSHPHEDQSQHCQLREVAAWLRWLASMGRVPSAESMLDRAEKIDSVALAIAAPAAQGDALDAARLDWLIEQDNCVVFEGVNGFCLCWIDEHDPQQSEYQIGTFPTARAAIDAARATQEGK